MNDFTLREFQEPGYNKLVTQKRHLLLYAPGLGKTVVCVKAAYDANCTNILVVCPKNAIKVWENHFQSWFDGLDVALGKVTEETETTFHIWRWRKKYNHPEKRKALWRSYDKDAKFNIYITTFAGVIYDEEHFVIPYKLVIIDEAKRIRSRKALAFKALQRICKHTEYIWALTGTPGFQPSHFWTMFNLIAPKDFGSYWRFVEAFYVTIKNQWGGKEIIAFKNRDSWFDLLRRKATILTKEDIGHTPTIRGIKYAELDECQESYYKQYAEEMYAVIGDKVDITYTSLLQVLRYRQLLICPKIIDPSLSIGGALADLVDSFQEEEADPHCVIFCPFTDAFPHFAKYLAEMGYPGVLSLQGGITPDEQEQRINQWRSSKVPILCSISYAQAFSLEPAKEAYFIGYDWDPDNNIQAEERLNRLTTKYAVTCFYYLYEDTYDEKQLEIVNSKAKQKNMIMPTKK